MKSFRGYFFILGATSFWGISASGARFLFSQNINPLILVQTRMTISCVVLIILLLILKRDLLRVKIKDIHRFVLLGIIGGAGSNFFYYYAIKETNVATAILLQYMAPLLVLSYSAFSKTEIIDTKKIVAGVVSLTGCFLALGGKSFSLNYISQAGLLAGTGAAFCWAYANISMRHLVHSYNSWTILVYMFIVSSLFWLCINTPAQVIAANYSGKTWLMFSGFAMISILIPHSFYFLGIRYLTATQAIITATSEPIIAIVIAYIFLNESLSIVQMLGAVLVISAIIILQQKTVEAALVGGAEQI